MYLGSAAAHHFAQPSQGEQLHQDELERVGVVHAGVLKKGLYYIALAMRRDLAFVEEHLCMIRGDKFIEKMKHGGSWRVTSHQKRLRLQLFALAEVAQAAGDCCLQERVAQELECLILDVGVALNAQHFLEEGVELTSVPWPNGKPLFGLKNVRKTQGKGLA